MASLESVSFDILGLEPGRREANKKFWATTDGDAVELDFFNWAPDLPGDLGSLRELEQFYRDMMKSSPDKLVELAILQVDQCPATRVIIKGPQQPHGTRYMGSVSLPFRDLSYVIKVECRERGSTGVREATLLDRLLAEGKVSVDAKSDQVSGDWSPDDAAYDAEFPEHPLSRLRAWLTRIENSCVVDPGVRGLPGFPLPSY